MPRKPKPNKPGIPNMGNTVYIQAMRGLRQSNAATAHVLKPRRGTRSVRNHNAIQDSKDD